MRTIKIIDLLNKIANGEEVPEKFRYVEKTYERIDDDDIVYYMCKTTGKLLLDVLDDTHDLRDDIEILDEEDEFEDIEELYSCCMETKDLEKQVLRDNINTLSERINQLIKNQKKIIERLNDES